MRLLPMLALPCLLIAGIAPADDTHFSVEVHDVAFTSSLPRPGVTIRNVSPGASVADADVRVVSGDPTIEVEIRATCKPGAKVTAAQLMYGEPVVTYNAGGPVLYDWFVMAPGDPTPLPGTAGVETVTLSEKLAVSKAAGEGALLSYTFNPVARFEQKLLAFVQGGGSAAEYLRQTESFDMVVPVAAACWCASGKYVDGGWEYPGVRVKNMTVSVLYEGDHDIVDGPGVRASGAVGGVAAPRPDRARDQVRAQGAGGAPPARDTPPRNTPPRDTPPPAVSGVRAPAAASAPEPAPAAMLLPAIQKMREAAVRSDDPDVGLGRVAP